jgi:DNA transposition AAA+ family ATPase
MAEVLRLAKVKEAQTLHADFLLTETAKDCLRALHGIHAANEARFTMIAGTQGVGKTKALRHFASIEAHVYPFTVYRTEGTSSAVSEVLMRYFMGHEKSNGKSISTRREMLSERLGGRGYTLIFDEAHNFDPDGMEWLTMVAEAAGCSVAFVGGVELPFLVEKCQSLSGRIPFPVIIRNAAKEDAESVARNAGVVDPDALNLLAVISQSRGGLRNVALTVERARMLSPESEITANLIRKVAGSSLRDGVKA